MKRAQRHIEWLVLSHAVSMHTVRRAMCMRKMTCEVFLSTDYSSLLASIAPMLLLLPPDLCASIPSAAGPAVFPCVFCWCSPTGVVDIVRFSYLSTALAFVRLCAASFAVPFSSASMLCRHSSVCACHAVHASRASPSEPEFIQMFSCDVRSLRYWDVLFVHRHDTSIGRLAVLLEIVLVLAPMTVLVSHTPPLFLPTISPVVALTPK